MILSTLALAALCAPLALDSPDELEKTSTAQIQWFTTWDQAKAEAARTGRPILFTSAAPQCSGVPGIW